MRQSNFLKKPKEELWGAVQKKEIVVVHAILNKIDAAALATQNMMNAFTAKIITER